MMVTPARLRLLSQSASQAIVDAIAPALDAPMQAISLLERAHFLAQVCHESAGFTRLLENLNYSADRIAQVWPRLAPRAAELAHNPEKLANAAYANKLGNGDEASGDGFRFRGRGLIQITGRANYASAASWTGTQLIVDPDKAAEPFTAVRIALAFWREHKCSFPAQLDDVEAVTQRINGPRMEGLEHRRALTEKAKRIFV